MASAVCTPWPISLWFIASSTPPSAAILIQPFRPTSPSTTGSVSTPPRRGARRQHAPAHQPARRRRPGRVSRNAPALHLCRGDGADGGANPRVGAAAADVGDRGVDLGVARRAVASRAAPPRPSACRSGSSRIAAPGARARPAAADAAAPALPSASIVTTRLPRTASSGVTHERTALPSTCTVQAPQAATPQPNLVPVRPSRSRSAHSSGICGGASSSGRARDAPLTTISTPLLAAAGRLCPCARIGHAPIAPRGRTGHRCGTVQPRRRTRRTAFSTD